MDSLTIGLTHINNAIGNIGKYIVVMNKPKFLTIIFALIVLKMDLPLIYIGVVYVSIEAICAFVRVPLIKEQAGLDVKDFYLNVIINELIPAIVCVVVCWSITFFFDFPFRCVLTFALSAVCYSLAMYYLGFTYKEKGVVDRLLSSVTTKVRNKIRK